MEIPILYLISFFLPVAFILVFFNKKSSWNLPPGPWKLPLIGNMHNLIGDLPHRALHQLARKYGPLMHLQLGEIDTVIVSSAEVAKEVMKTHDVNFASRPSIQAAENMGYGCKTVSFAPYGYYWRQLRKICTLELLSVKRVHSFQALREKVYSDLTKWIASKEGLSLNLTEKLYSSTYSFTTTVALGNKEHENLLPIMKENIELAAGFDIAEVFPSVKLFRVMSGVRRRLCELHEEADKILERIIHQHREGSDSHQEDLVDVLLRIQSDSLEIPLTDTNIKAVIMDMVFAGSETSATTINWAEMLKNPRILKKAQDEVREVFDKEGYVEESRIQELKYFKAIVNETLRLHPPLPLLLPRKCNQTCEINGYEIQPETRVLVNAWAINRDPKYWKNAHCFEPERFVDNSLDFRGSQMEFIPFGAGRRICPGMNFGIANVELPLAMFLYHFDWKLADGIQPEDMDMTEGSGVTARMKKDLYLVPIIKRPFHSNSQS